MDCGDMNWSGLAEHKLGMVAACELDVETSVSIKTIGFLISWSIAQGSSSAVELITVVIYLFTRKNIWD
jgi:hypothetical protein